MAAIHTIMSDREAIGTLSFFAVTLAICTGSCIALAQRAKPAVRAIAGHSRSELMLGSPDDAAMGTTAQLVTNWSTIYGHRRIALLFLSNVLLIGECLNSLVYYSMLWRAPHLTNTPINYLLDGVTIIPAGTIICLATTYRIALILVTHPSARQKLMKAATTLAVVIPLTLFIKIAVGVVQYWHITVDEWQKTTIVQPEIAILIALYPTLTISGSVWSIKVVLTRSYSSPVACTASKWEPNAISRTATLAPDESGLSASSSAGPALNASASSSHGVKSPAPAPAAPVVLADSLKTTFALLTLLMALYWLTFVLFLAMDKHLGGIRNMAVMTFIGSAAAATEASFEWMLRTNRQASASRGSAGGGKRSGGGKDAGKVGKV